MLKRSLLNWIIVILLTALSTQGMAQGVTTAAMNGRITGSDGEGLPGATVVAVHTPSGTQYATATRADGRYNFPNMRVGGPYTVTSTFVGYQEQKKEGITLSLGQNFTLDIQLQESNVQLGEVVVTAQRDDVMNADRTGAATNISNQTIQSIPTISRGLRDFTKLSPLANTAGSGTSFAGSNNRYNQFAIDGLVTNDVFGLSGSGTNGGQAGTEPISLDAIQEFQINIAPYDVRQGGFTGGGINAVTRSGSNRFDGSVYFFGNYQKLVSRNDPIREVQESYPKYKDYQVGFRVGGPILKNKLFFFLNGEMTRQTFPLAFAPGTTGSNISEDEAIRVVNVLKRVAPNYDPGTYESIDDEINSNKWLAKLDWNINNNHKLTVRHSYTYGERIDNSRNPNQLRFYNNAEFFPSTTNSTGIELNSTFGGKFSNNLLIGYTRVRDDRDPLGSPFPNVNIQLGSGRSILLGSEASSVANQLDQNIFSVTDNFNIYKGKHTFTLGTHNEFYSFYNLFVQNIYGAYSYRSLANFETIGTPGEIAPSRYAIGYSLATDDNPSQGKGASEFNAYQLGFYAQDDFAVTNNLKLIGGLRIDIPVFNSTPRKNEAFDQAYADYDVATDRIPKTRILWSPRIGFNWDVTGDKSTQVRGGTGVFTGRVPFVWISNQYINNGLVNVVYSTGTDTGNPLTNPTKFQPDPFNQPSVEQVGGRAGASEINVTKRDFRFPQVWRTNFAIDQRLPYGFIATLEGIYTRTLNNVTFNNLNRVVDPEFTFVGPDQRPRYRTGRVDPNFAEIIELGNTSKGYTYNIIAQLQRQFENGWSGSLAYTFGESKDINPGSSSTAYSNWRFIENVNGANNYNELSYSDFHVRHRIVGAVTYRKEYLKNFATQVTLFYNGQTGQTLSYYYDGDLNNDGTSNDLIYVPRDISEANLVVIPASGNTPAVSAEEQWNNLNAFIEGDEYLKERRGQYTERNGARLPFQHQFDFRFLQEFGINVGNTTHKLQFTFDLINVGNLFNKDWGRQYNQLNQQFALIDYVNLQTGTNRPTFRYDGGGFTNGKPYGISDLSSRWRGQLGLRYIFN